jgi:hypothetical protein
MEIKYSSLHSLENGLHLMQRVSVTQTWVIDLGPNTTVLDDLGGKPGYWGRRSTTQESLSFHGQHDAEWQFTLDGSVLSVTATSNCYKVTTGPNGEVINRWIPVPPDKIEMPYSVHLRDNYHVGLVEEGPGSGLRLYPNPAANQLIIAWEEEAKSFAVHDAQGKLVASLNRLPAGQRQHQLNVEAWADGLYTVQLNGTGKRQVQRFAKH